jgi:hypothetical protein
MLISGGGALFGLRQPSAAFGQPRSGRRGAGVISRRRESCPPPSTRSAPRLRLMPQSGRGLPQSKYAVRHPHLMTAANNYGGLLRAMGDTKEQARAKVSVILAPVLDKLRSS